LVGHGKIDIGKIAFCKKSTSQGNVIYFSIIEITVKKVAINKSYSKKIAISKVTIVKRTIFKVFVFNVFFFKNGVAYFLVKDVICVHFYYVLFEVKIGILIYSFENKLFDFVFFYL
jgi:hypothetical protein